MKVITKPIELEAIRVTKQSYVDGDLAVFVGSKKQLVPIHEGQYSFYIPANVGDVIDGRLMVQEGDFIVNHNQVLSVWNTEEFLSYFKVVSED